jgi:hypothetical protein
MGQAAVVASERQRGSGGTEVTTSTSSLDESGFLVRAPEISERLIAHFRGEMGWQVIEVDAATWRGLPVEPRFRFGWMPPVPLTNDPESPVVVTLSPDLLDEITKWLTDELLDNYLTTLEAFIDAYVWKRKLPPDEVMRFVEDELLVKAPSALQLMSEVEAEAISDGLVPLLH